MLLVDELLLLRQRQVLPHPLHLVTEPLDRLAQFSALELTEDLLPVPDCIRVMERRVEVRL